MRLEKKEFEWERFDIHGMKNCPIYYVSNKIQIKLPHNHEFVIAKITARNNGPYTAVAEIYFTVEWPTNDKNKWYTSLMRHFKTGNAVQSAKTWCNYLLNNPIYYIHMGNGLITQDTLSPLY